MKIPEDLHAVKARIICLLTSDIKSWKLIGVSRETLEEALKSLNIAPKVLARRSNTMWNILLATEQEAKQLAGSVLLTAVIQLQMEYMGTQWT